MSAVFGKDFPIDIAETRLPFTQRLFRSADAAQPQIGDMPPQPRTLRGRAGALFVRLVQRMLFWYTDQLRAFHKTVSAAAGEQARALQQLDAAGVARQREVVSTLSRLEAEHRQHLAVLADRLDRTERAVKTHERRWNSLLEVSQQSSSKAADAEPALSDEARHMTDALFVEHAVAFRGSRAEIKRRLEVYLPYALEALAATAGAPALDLGCGRGEWLELLRDSGFTATGIDSNRDLAGENRARGLDAIDGDILEVFRTLPDESRSIVTAFHVLEHVPFQDLVEIIDHTIRVLKPGGIAIFETPDPKNLLVSTNNFYLDPTHRHPLPSELLAFVVEARGLSDPKIIPLSPFPDSFHLQGPECPAVQFINDHFFGPQEYGLVARKT